MNRTNDEFREFLATNYLSAANAVEIDAVLELYPDDVARGSPYDTGSVDALTPEFKRLCSFHGDLVFQGPRRFFLKHTSDKQSAWAFRESYICRLKASAKTLAVSKLSKTAFPLGSVSQSGVSKSRYANIEIISSPMVPTHPTSRPGQGWTTSSTSCTT